MTLNRRSFLRGTAAGSAVAVGLPFLDCFLNDSGTALASGAPIPLRFGSWFWGLGHTPGRGIAMDGKPEITFLEETQPLAPYVNDLNYF
ncbi:MAG: twin-arginine translocation signal domain-containing protein, partial [Rhodospirillaceae bacterium]|nr:twin-arginine translocation signal domain-containing protein [Rhodospirillaceae bacterium]